MYGNENKFANNNKTCNKDNLKTTETSKTILLTTVHFNNNETKQRKLNTIEFELMHVFFQVLCTIVKN